MKDSENNRLEVIVIWRTLRLYPLIIATGDGLSELAVLDWWIPRHGMISSTNRLSSTIWNPLRTHITSTIYWNHSLTLLIVWLAWIQLNCAIEVIQERDYFKSCWSEIEILRIFALEYITLVSVLISSNNHSRWLSNWEYSAGIECILIIWMQKHIYIYFNCVRRGFAAPVEHPVP
jgi:hypothetical protein